jgi:excisionase family DNA binding protein
MERTNTPEFKSRHGGGFARVSEAAAYLAISRAHLYALMEQGSLRFAKLGRSRRVLWSDLEELARKSLVGTDSR